MHLAENGSSQEDVWAEQIDCDDRRRIARVEGAEKMWWETVHDCDSVSEDTVGCRSQGSLASVDE